LVIASHNKQRTNKRTVTEKGIKQRARWIEKHLEKIRHHLEIIENEGGALGRKVSLGIRSDTYYAEAESIAESVCDNPDIIEDPGHRHQSDR
jgi:hypothetical protein